MRASIPYFTGRKRTRNERVMAKTAKKRSELSLSVVDKTAYLGGNVCAKILSDPLQLGPRAKTLRQEVHFSYRTQLSDRQELLRSSRNLSQKMTPWHKEHSDGLRSQDHILRTQSSPLCKACTVGKVGKHKLSDDTKIVGNPTSGATVFLTRNKLICEPGHIGKKTHPCTTWNSRIAKNLSGSAGIPIGKLPSNGPKTPRWPLFAGPYLTSPSSDFPRIRNLAKSRQRKLSDGTKNVKIRHRELGQICARTGTRFEKKRAGSKTHFFSRTAAFARRVFPARNKLIREPGCVGKIMTPATTWNSRFADSIPRLTGIFIGKVHKNSSDTPTSGSHNSLVRTPIRANFISLERGRRELSGRYACMTHFEFRKTSKTAPENRIKKGTRTEIEEDSRSCWRGRIRLPRGSTTTRAGPSCAAHDGAARGVHTVFYKTDPPPPHFSTQFLL
uniref:Uncharacterized protein n=1 Tax=Fagus sylvatica TaxID=28930 RepID=A0A2N9H4X8_FAGSY